MRRALCILALVLGGADAMADDEQPAAYDIWFDAGLAPHPKNPSLDHVLEGDTVTVHVDPTRLFPDAATPIGNLGFAVDNAPPELHGFYVAGPGAGKGTELLVQPELCGLAAHDAATVAAKQGLDDVQAALKALDPNADQAAKDLATKAVQVASDALAKLEDEDVAVTEKDAAICVPAPDWELTTGALPYVCHGERTLKDLIGSHASWSLVQRVGTDKVACLAEWTFKLASPVAALTVEVTSGGNPAEAVNVAANGGTYTTKVQIKSNTRELRLTTMAGSTRLGMRTVPVKAGARDSHSRLRIQAELMAANRLRAVSFAVALTPVSRKMFTDGPGGCIIGCRVTLSAILRIAGDDKTVVQFGGAVGVNLVRAFQVNGGLLFGTDDTTSAWRIERNWFVGIAIDPVILSEALTSSTNKD